MMHRSIPRRRPMRLPIFLLKLSLPIMIFCALAALSMRSEVAASTQPARQDMRTMAGDTCAAATVINPAALPFFDEATNAGAANDIDPGPSACAPGPGSDVVYSFTPAATDIYTIGATPLASSFDLSLYIITDCANPAGSCVAGTNARAFGKGETLTVQLTAGTRYFVVVDNAQATGEGAFHFSLRRGTPANDACAAAADIAANRLPFSTTATTFGAANDFNPGAPCVRNNQSANGPDIIYSFTSPDSQNYDITVTPMGNFDVTLYVVTNCVSLAGCTSADIGGGGDAETLRRNLTQGTTYYIIVDGFQGDAGDFTLTLVPTLPKTPAAPTNLVAKAVSPTEIDLTWQDNATDEQGYRIERSLDGQNFIEIATVGPNVQSYPDTGLTPETTYFYRVFAFNNFGNSDPSNIAADTTPKPPLPSFPVINVAPTSIEFGSVRGGNTATQKVTITNQGGVDLVITQISNPTGPFTILSKPATPLTLASGASIELTVQFQPPATGRFAGSFTITSNDPSTPVVTVILGGTGTSTPVPNLEVSQAVIDFPNGSSVTTLELKNTGDADLLLANIQAPTFPFGMSGTPAFPTTLKPGDSLLLTVSFSPTAPGVYTGRLTIVSNDPDSLLTVITLRGTSTPQNEAFKLRAPAQVNAVAGQSNTINVIAANGGSDIHLTATAVAGGTFTDRGNGRGDLVITPAASAVGSNLRVIFTATDSQNRSKSFPTTITVVSAADVVQVQVLWTPPASAPASPTGAAAIDTFLSQIVRQPTGAAPATLVGYAIYRGTAPGVQPQLSSLVGVAPATATSFTDNLPKPAAGQLAAFRYFYVVTALYRDGTESAASNETSTLPRIVDLSFRGKGIHLSAVNVNITAGAVIIVDGTERYTLQLSGDEWVVGKNDRSTPGNAKPKALIQPGSTHTFVVQNPNGQTSLPVTATR
ncbi:MAG TPA: choice-of-anchor D domain-containing protein [Blastocatellia bacterium]|nr:choice-of-anchor D domain-containing protein [Blastocatellia bacterium]